jgi:ATP-dependent RNA helicase RhlE
LTTFSALNLAEPIARALETEGYTIPTPIQMQAIPPALERKDILGIAQTGTGKTAAFALPILDRLAREPKPLQRRATRVLVLAPTRELASQIADSFRAYGANLSLTIETVFGGVPVPRHVKRMEKGADILVATPGRLIDLMEQKALYLHHVEVLVLDEADQMLDLGFIHALRRIVPLVPKGRQTLFFSATMPKTIAELADSYLKDPVRVAVAPVATTAERVDQRVIFSTQSEKIALLVHTLRDPAVERALVFTRTKHGADRVVRNLERVGIACAAIHGNKSQPQRVRALEAFRGGACPVLVATDIAARGIDVDGVSHVINYEVPNIPEQYVHRIGRTARAGREGIAVSFVAGDERPFLKDIEKLTRQKIAVLPLPDGMSELMAEFKASQAQADAEDALRARFDPAARGGEGGGRRQGRSGAGGGRDGAHGGGRGGGRGEGRGPRSEGYGREGPARGDGGRDGARSGAAKPARTEGARAGGPSGSGGSGSFSGLARSMNSGAQGGGGSGSGSGERSGGQKPQGGRRSGGGRPGGGGGGGPRRSGV